MKYCIDYYNHIQEYENADEYTIKYTNKNDILIDFLEKNKTKRVNLTIEEKLTDTDYKLLKPISVAYPNLVLRFESYDADAIIDIAECGIPFFYGNKINNWDELLGFIELGVTDVYIVEDLCFDLERVAAVAHAEDVNLRTFANVAQSTWKYTPEIKTFWIRPEDISIYEKYIDVIEFFGSPNQIKVLLKVYKEDKKWFGKLNEIIIGIKSNLDSRYISSQFAEKRVSCNKECIKGGKCKVCDRIIELSATLKNANLIAIQKKNK